MGDLRAIGTSGAFVTQGPSAVPDGLLIAEMLTDLDDVFFDDFAVSARFTHGASATTIYGIFDKERLVILDGAETTRPTYETKTSSVSAITKVTDTLAVGGTTYKIRDYFRSSDQLTTTLVLSID